MALIRSRKACSRFYLLGLYFVAISAFSQEADEKSSLIEVHLTASASELNTCVAVQFLNRAEVDLYIPGDIAEERRDLSDVFDLETNQGEAVPFLGRIYKRLPLTVEDAVLLPASGDVVSIICLDEFYDIREDLKSIRYKSDTGVSQLIGGQLEIYSFELLISNVLTL